MRPLNLDGVEIGGKDVVKAYKASCGRLSCPVCYEKACGKEALKIAHRIGRFKIKGRNLKPIHVVVSPPDSVVVAMGNDFPAFRKKAYKLAMECGVFGGCIIFHPFRKYNEDDLQENIEEGFSHKISPASWYLSPHFHIIGYGWVHRVKEMHARSGWVVKNLGVRKSVRATALYQLSHCGVNERFHTVVWFGALACNKMSCPPLPPEEHKCPLCGSEMEKVIVKDGKSWDIVKSKLDQEGFYYFKHGLFVPVPISRRLEGG